MRYGECAVFVKWSHTIEEYFPCLRRFAWQLIRYEAGPPVGGARDFSSVVLLILTSIVESVCYIRSLAFHEATNRINAFEGNSGEIPGRGRHRTVGPLHRLQFSRDVTVLTSRPVCFYAGTRTDSEPAWEHL